MGERGSGPSGTRSGAVELVVGGGLRRRCRPRSLARSRWCPPPGPRLGACYPRPPSPPERNRALSGLRGTPPLGLVTSTFSPISILSRIETSELVISATCFLLVLCYSTYLDYQKEYF